MGWLVSDHLPGFHRRSESNMGLRIHSAFGCCIQASMIMGLLLPDAREMAVAAETTREPRGTSRTFLDKRVDAIVH
jgi:hypothetical protein